MAFRDTYYMFYVLDDDDDENFSLYKITEKKEERENRHKNGYSSLGICYSSFDCYL
jgi:hypothetical protein